MLFKGRQPRHTVRQARPTLVEQDEPAVLSESFEEARRLWKLPRDLPVGDPPRHENNVHVARADDLVADVDAVGPSEFRLGDPSHMPNVPAVVPTFRKACPTTPVTLDRRRQTSVRAVWYDRQGGAAEVLQPGELPAVEPGPSEVRVRVALSDRPDFPFWPMLFDNIAIRLLGSDDFPVEAKRRPRQTSQPQLKSVRCPSPSTP